MYSGTVKIRIKTIDAKRCRAVNVITFRYFRDEESLFDEEHAVSLDGHAEL